MWWSRWRTSPYYRPSLFSLGIHVTLLILLSVSWLWSSTPATMSMVQSPQEAVEIIQATAVSEQQYEQEVKEIEQAQQRAEQQESLREQQRVAAEKAVAAQAAAEQKRQVEEQQRKVQAEQQKIAEQKLAEAQQKVVEEQRKAQEEQALAAQKKIAEQQKAAEAQRLEEQKQAEAAAAEKAAAEAQRKAEEERLRQQQVATEQAALAAQQQTYVSGELNRFDALITQKISSMWIVPVGADPALEVHLVVRLAPDGSVLNAKIQQSSGNDALDQSALDAVYKASPLPVPTDVAVFNEMRTLNITVTPQMVL